MPIAVAVLLLAGLVHAWSLRWVCDDAFISFRYAAHLADGLGLVYNAGEHVEGYSNFLWTIAIAAGIALGAEPVVLAQALGLACHAATLALCWFVAERRWPIAALALAGHYHVKVWATGGLETSWFGLLVTGLVVRLVTAHTARHFATAGLIATLATLTRPDGALLYASAAGVTVVARLEHRRRALLALAAPGLVVLVPYLIWKQAYFGELVPNTFYAKSAHDPYPRQGLVYVLEYLRCHYVLAPAVPLAVWLLVRRRRAAPAAGWDGTRAPLAILAVVTLYTGFVVWVGGDFMFARFLVPVTAPLLLVYDLVWRDVRATWLRVLLAAGVPLAALFCNYPAQFGTGTYYAGLSEEPKVYTREFVAGMRSEGARLRELTAGLDVRVLITGVTAMLAYEARFPVVIEGASGLTDRTIARRSLARRGWVGHEKEVDPLDDYVRSRGVQLSFARGKAGDATDEVRWLWFGDKPVFLVRYDGPLLRELARRAPDYVRYTPCEEYLDRYLARAATMTRDELERDYLGFRRFYFADQPDLARQQRFEQLLGR